MAPRRKPKRPITTTPTRVVSFAEQGRINRRVQERVAIERAKRTAPLRRGKLKRAFTGRGVDAIGPIVRGHLEAATGHPWASSMARPRSYWERRFVFSSTPAAHYDDVRAAFEAIERDQTLEVLLEGRAVTVWVVVIDPATGDELLLTLAAFGQWDTALLDALRKIEEWTERYLPEQEDSDIDSGVKRIIMFVGRK